MSDKAMCSDKAQASANRERIANDYGGSWWREQERTCAGWEQDTVAPKSLALGNLPIILHAHTVSKHLPRFDDR